MFKKIEFLEVSKSCWVKDWAHVLSRNFKRLVASWIRA
ncbi:hypothetical protein SLEP1_g3578 [Rubroshorea leprosula]|uniref:Uncharacterized protein n=1 Tax=Rubroshorea leprosula TaxID=152421 RepID=A0AAV5HUL4_9ROSI|nr:hypothetical protein SLEP1_g3578 [Rubroshorea leprosula]